MKLALALVLIAATPAFGATADAYVDAIHGSDTTGLGTPASPFRTISKAVQSLSSVSGATNVHVAPGVYGPSLGEVLPIHLNAQMSILGSGAHHTIVTAEGRGTIFRLAAQGLISDMTLRRADLAVESIGDCFLGGPMRYLRRCTIRDSKVGLRVADCLHSDHGVAVVNCTVTNNDVGLRAQSTDNDFQSVSLLVYGTTVTGNSVGLESLGPGSERYLGLFDSIVRGNGNDAITGWLSFLGITGNVLGDPTYVGANGNVGIDPGFVAAPTGDVHLKPLSSAVDNPAPVPAWPPQAMWTGSFGWIWESAFTAVSDLDGDPRQVGAQIDPGADEVLVPTLYVHGTPALGQTVVVSGQGNPSDILYVFLSQGLLDAPLLGLFWLDVSATPLTNLTMDASGVGGFEVQVPPVAAFAGIDVYLQALRSVGSWFDATSPVRIRLLP